MASMMESTLTAEQHALLRDVLVAQTESHGAIELPTVLGILRRHAPRSVLDVGCGEGSFLLRVAASMPGASFAGIDHSERAIEDAARGAREAGVGNATFRAAFFDSSFDPTQHDAVITRYTLQHASHPRAFVESVLARLKPGGVFLALESLDAYTDCHVPDPTWVRFRSAVAAVHQRVGSDANVGKALGSLMLGAGFRDIQVRVLLCSPATVGVDRFRRVVRASAHLAHAFFPDLFDGQLRADVDAWLEDSGQLEERDPYLCSAVANGTKP